MGLNNHPARPVFRCHSSLSLRVYHRDCVSAVLLSLSPSILPRKYTRVHIRAALPRTHAKLNGRNRRPVIIHANCVPSISPYASRTTSSRAPSRRVFADYTRVSQLSQPIGRNHRLFLRTHRSLYIHTDTDRTAPRCGSFHP